MSAYDTMRQLYFSAFDMELYIRLVSVSLVSAEKFCVFTMF